MATLVTAVAIAAPVVLPPLAAASQHGPSFYGTGASSAVERAVCKDADLAMTV